MNELRDRVLAEVRRVVVGQDETVERLLAAALVGGHVLLEGAPGVAKTLLANATARALGLSFQRVQFTSAQGRSFRRRKSVFTAAARLRRAPTAPPGGDGAAHRRRRCPPPCASAP